MFISQIKIKVYSTVTVVGDKDIPSQQLFLYTMSTVHITISTEKHGILIRAHGLVNSCARIIISCARNNYIFHAMFISCPRNKYGVKNIIILCAQNNNSCAQISIPCFSVEIVICTFLIVYRNSRCDGMSLSPTTVTIL